MPDHPTTEFDRYRCRIRPIQPWRPKSRHPTNHHRIQKVGRTIPFRMLWSKNLQPPSQQNEQMERRPSRSPRKRIFSKRIIFYFHFVLIKILKKYVLSIFACISLLYWWGSWSIYRFVDLLHHYTMTAAEFEIEAVNFIWVVLVLKWLALTQGQMIIQIENLSQIILCFAFSKLFSLQNLLSAVWIQHSWEK